MTSYPNIDNWHWWKQVFQSRIHDDSGLGIPSCTFHEQAMDIGAVTWRRPGISDPVVRPVAY